MELLTVLSGTGPLMNVLSKAVMLQCKNLVGTMV